MFFKKKEKLAQEPAHTVTVQNFNDLVINTKKLAVVDFWAPWCGPCKVMGPILDELNAEYKDEVMIGKVNVDSQTALSSQFQIRSIPTLLFIKDGKIVEHFSGVVPKPNMEELIKKYK